MSFLLEESAARAFAFAPDVLNLLDSNEGTWPVPLVQSEPAAHDRKTKPPQSKHDSNKKTKPRVRKRPATPRLRNKAKIELLRREIASLEEELEALQQSNRTLAIQAQSRKTSPTTDSSLSAWKGIASRQSKERERAQLRNKGLKKMISEQHMLTMSLSSVLSELSGLSSLSACV